MVLSGAVVCTLSSGRCRLYIFVAGALQAVSMIKQSMSAGIDRMLFLFSPVLFVNNTPWFVFQFLQHILQILGRPVHAAEKGVKILRLDIHGLINRSNRLVE